MSSPPLWELSARVPSAHEDALAALFEHALGVAPTVYAEVRTGRSRVSFYGQESREQMEARRLLLRKTLQACIAVDPGFPCPRFRMLRVRREDWAESWKRHFQPIEVSDRLLIRPSWSRRKARRGQRILVLDPGLSFGTGQHPTTLFCLQELDDTARRRPGFSLLDAGTGSGILALAAAKLGAGKVEAFDFDPVAVGVAQANARRNRLDGSLTIRRRDLTRMSVTGPGWDVICANLTADLLETHVGKLAARLQHDGILVLAGILRSQFPAVEDACRRGGLILRRSRVGGEWRSGSFARGRVE